MQIASRLILVILFFLLALYGCHRGVKPDKLEPPGNAPMEGRAEIQADQTGNMLENESSTWEVDQEPTASSDAESDFDDADFDEFEDEFGDEEVADVFDPLSGYNRFMTGFNDKLYFWVLKPVATGYRWVIPEFARRGISNFFKNLYFPVRLVNNVLQFKFKNAGEETLRFATNSTIGLLGLWDPAKIWFGLEAHPEDFGQTLGVWGVGPGPHIVLPVLGPSNIRDTVALVPTWVYLNPINNFAMVSDWVGFEEVGDIEKTEVKLGMLALERVNETSFRIGEYENLKKDAIDFYPFLRDLYEQNRLKEIEE